MEIINSVESLREALTEKLDKSFRGEITAVKPNKPMLIVYTGKKAYEGKVFVEKAMRRVWKNKTEDICQIMLEGGELCESDGSVSDCNGVSEEKLYELVENMQTKGGSFNDLSSKIVVYVHNAADFNDISEFKAAYANIINMKEMLGGSSCTGMSMIMLDESFKKVALSKEIRSYIRDQVESSERVSRKTMLLSNRTKRGELLSGARAWENYDLLGNLLIMLNCSSSEFTTNPDKFFTNVRPTVLTASYSVINRPNKDICDVIINRVLRWLETRISSGAKGSWDEICKKLEISGNTFPFLKNYYETKAKTTLVPIDKLEYLPRMNVNNTEPLLAMPYNMFLNETMGAFEAFFKENYEGKFSRDIAAMGDFRRAISDYVKEKIPAELAISSLSEDLIENLLKGLSVTSYPENAPAGTYIEGLLYNTFWEEAKEIFREELVARKKGASGHLGTIEAMISAFIDSYNPPSDESVILYYTQYIDQRLNDSMGNAILERINSVEKTSENILTAVYESISNLFFNEPIFSMPLEKELQHRMGSTAVDVTNIVKTLTDPLIGNRRLATTFDPDPGAKFVMINKTNELIPHMKSYFGTGSDAVFLDTGDSNSMAIVALYECNSTTLL